MSALLDRLSAAFLTPPSPGPDAAGAPRTPVGSLPRTVALLGRTEAPTLALALARRLRASHRAPAAIVARWPGDATHRGTTVAAWPAAAALARRLSAHGLAARATWRLVLVDLPSAPETAAAAAARVLVAAGETTPVACALTGPLQPWMRPLLDAHDAIVLQLPQAAPPELETLAAEAFADAPAAPTVVRWSPGPLTTALIHAALHGGPPDLREAFR